MNINIIDIIHNRIAASRRCSALLLYAVLLAGLSAPVFVAAQTTPSVSITRDSEEPVMEGTAASFTVFASPLPDAPLTVNLFVEDTGSDFVAADDEGSQTVTIPTTGRVTYTVPTVDNDIGEPGRPLTVTLQSGDGYEVNSNRQVVSVTIANDDFHNISISVTPAAADEGDSGGLTDAGAVTVSVNPPRPEEFFVGIERSGTAIRGGTDYLSTDADDSPLPEVLRIPANQSTVTLKIRVNGDTADELDETAILSLAPILFTGDTGDTLDETTLRSLAPILFTEATGVVISPTAGSVTYTIQDDDPTVVSLARTGTGALDGDTTIEFTVTLGRELIAGEIIDVPLSIGGTGVTTDNWSGLVPASGADNTGVTLSAQTTATPQLRFTGAGAQTAVLELTAAPGSSAETYVIALGPNDTSANGFDRSGVTTNVDGGADPHATANTFSVPVNAVSGPGVVISQRAVALLTETGLHTYTVMLATQPAGNVEIAVASEDTSTVTVMAPSTLTFTTMDWSTAQVVTVAGVDDDIVNLPYRSTSLTHRISSSNDSSNYPTTLDLASVSVRVRDDDGPGRGLMTNVDEVTLTEGAADATYTVRLQSDPTADVTVAITGETGADLALTPPALTFAPTNWYTPQAVTVTALADTAATDKQFVLTHTASGADYNNSVDPVQVTVNVTDPFVVSVRGATVAEGGDLVFTVTLRDPAPEGGLTMAYTTVDGRDRRSDAGYQIATAGDDYTANSGTLTIAEDDDEATLTVSTINDDVYKSDHYLTLMLGDLTGRFTVGGTTATYTINAMVASAVGTITDLADRPEVSFSQSTFSVTEGDGAARPEIEREGASLVPIRLTVRVSDNTARRGDDYTSPESISAVIVPDDPSTAFIIDLVIDPGETTVIFPVGTVNDRVHEDSETVLLALLGRDLILPDGTPDEGTLDGHAIFGRPKSSVVTILDNDEPDVSLERDMASITEGQTATFTLSLTNPADQDHTFDLSLTEEGAFLSGGAETVRFTIPAGQRQATYSLFIPDDSVDEPDGRLMVSISARPSGIDFLSGESRNGRATIEVFDNGGVPTVSVSAPERLSEDDSAVVYTLSANPPPSAALAVSLVVSETRDFIAAADEITHIVNIDDNGEGELRIPIVNDDLDEADTLVTATIATDTAYIVALPPGDSAAVQIEDRDGTDPDLVLSLPQEDGAEVTTYAQVAMQEGGADVTYTAVLTTAPQQDVTVTISGHEGAGLTPIPVALTFTPINWNLAQTVTLQADEDDDKADEGLMLVHSASGDNSYRRVSAEVPVAVTDNDTAAGVSISETELTVSESGLVVRAYNVMLNAIPAGDVEIAAVSGDTSTATVAPPTLTFTTMDWNTAQMVSVTGVEDTIYNPDNRRTTAISHTINDDNTVSGLGYTSGLEIADVTVTVTNNDGGLLVTPTMVEITEGVTGAAANTYQVVLSQQPTAAVTVAITGAPDELTLSASSLTFTTMNWNMSQPVTLGVAADDDAAGQSFALTHTATGGDYEGRTADVQVTVTDSDTAGLVLTPPSISLDEGSTTTYMAALASQPTAEVTVTITGNPDDLTLSDTMLTFTTTDWGTAQVVTLTSAQDTDAMDDNVTLTHTAAGGDYERLTADVQVTVVEDDTPGLLFSRAAIAFNEGDNSTYTVILTEQPVDTIMVSITGNPPGLTLSTAELTFTRGNWSSAQTVTLAAVQDADGASITVQLEHAASIRGFVLLRAAVQVTVADDDSGLVFNPQRVTLPEGSSLTYTVALASAPDGAVNVAITQTGSAAVSLGSDSLEFTQANWMEPQPVVVTAGTDSDTADEMGTLTHIASGGGYYDITGITGAGITGVLEVTAADRDGTAGVLISETAVTIDEAGGEAGYTVRLMTPPADDVVITAVSAMPLAAAASPGRLRFTPTNWSTPQQVTVTGISDDVDNPGDERMTAVMHAIAVGDGDDGSYPRDGLNPAAVTVTVTDDDAPPAFALSLTPALLSVTEGSTADYTVALTRVPTAPVTVAVSGHSGTGLTLGDTSLTFTTGDWDMPQAVTVTAASDDDVNGNAPVTLIHSASQGGYDGVEGTVTVSIAEDDFLVSMAPATVAEGGTLAFIVTRPPAAVANAITVTYVTTDGRGVDTDAVYQVATGSADGSNADYTATAGTLTIDAGDTEGTIMVPTTDDDVYESEHYLTLTLTGISSRLSIGEYEGEITLQAMNIAAVGSITDAADRPQVAAVAGADFYDEDDVMRFIFTKTGTTLVPAEITYAAEAGGSADSGDYTPVAGTLVFAPTEDEKVVDVPLVDDEVYEGAGPLAQRVAMVLSDLEHVVLEGSASVSASIDDSDDFPTVSVVAGMASIVEGSTATFVVSASNASSMDNTVTFTLSTQGTFFATGGTMSSVVFAAGVTPPSIEIEVATVADEADEPNGRLTLTLTDGSSYEIDPAADTATIEVTDDDGGPTVSIAAVTREVTEGFGARAEYAFTVNPPPTTPLGVSVFISQSGDFISSADEGTHPINVSGGSAQLSVNISNDNVNEADGTVTVTLLAMETYTLAPAPADAASVNVMDDDGTPPGLRFSTAELRVDEGGSGTYSVMLAGTPTAAVTVTITDAPTPNDLTLDADATRLTFTTANWNRAQMVTLTAAQDADGNDDMVTLTHTASGGDYASVEDAVEVTIVDSSSAGLVFMPARVSAAEGGSATYTVALTTMPTAAVTVTITGAPADLTPDVTRLVFTTDNWDMPQTVMLTADEDTDAADDVVPLTHTASGGDYGSVEDDVVVTVTENDMGLVLNPAQLMLEEGSTGAYTVRLVSVPTAAVTVEITGAPGDLTPDVTSLTFTAADWNRVQTVTLTADEDADTADEAAVTLTHTAGSNYGSVTGAVVVTVTDPDEVGVAFTPQPLRVIEGDDMSYATVLTARPAVAVTVRITGDSGTDLTLSTSVLTFAPGAWDTPQRVTLSAEEDADPADDMVMLTHTVLVGGFTATTEDLAVTVVDPDMGGLALTPARFTMDEGDIVTYTVALTAMPAGNVDVRVSMAGSGVSVNPSVPFALTFTSANWDREQIVTVTADADADAADESVILEHTVDASDRYDAVTGEVTVTVIDDDTAGLVLTPESLALLEGGSVSYTVALASEPTIDVMVAIIGQVGDDLTLSDARLTFTPDNWDVPQAVTVTASVDSDTMNDRVRLTHRAAGGEYSSVSGIVDVTVADGASGVVVASRIRATVAEGGSTTYTLRLNTQPAESVTVSVTSGAPDVVMVGSGGSLSLTFTTTNWRTPQEVTITGLDDGTNNLGGARTAVIRHAITTGDGFQGSYPVGLDIDDVTITVTDDDIPEISIAPADAMVTEGSSASFIVTADPAPGMDLTIPLTVAAAEVPGGGFVAPADLGARVVILPVGETSVPYTVPTRDDDIDEPDGEVSVTIAAGASYRQGTSTAAVTVRDDEETAVSITASRNVIVEGSSTSSADITLTLGQPLVAGQEVFVPVDFRGGPTAGVDYMLGLKEGVVNTGVTLLTSGDHAAGSTTLTATAQMPLVRFAGAGAQEAVLELTAPDRDGVQGTLRLDINSVGDAVRTMIGLGGGGQGDFSLANDNGIAIIDAATPLPASVSIEFSRAAYSVIENDGPAQPVVVLSGEMLDSLEIRLLITPGSAVDGVDYTAPVSFTVPGGASRASFDVLMIDDDIVEGNETFMVALDVDNLPEGLVAGTTTMAIVTIFDDDEAELEFSETALSVGEGDMASYTVALTSQPADAVAVMITGHSDTDLTPTPADLMFTPANWNVPQVVTVMAAQDVDAQDDMVVLAHTADSGTVTVTIVDDEAPRVVVSRAAVTVDEGGTDSYTVELNTAPTAAVAVTITGHSSTDLTPSVTDLMFTATNWNAPQAVTVTAAADVDAVNDIVTLTHTADSNYNSLTAAVTVTIADDTAPAGLTLSGGPVTVAENGGIATYTVVLDTRPASDVEIAAVSGDTSTATVAPPTLTFTRANWNVAQMATVTGVDDDIANAAARMADIGHSVSSGDGVGYLAGIQNPDAVTVTVSNNDTAGLMFESSPVTVAEGGTRTGTYAVALTSEPTADVEVAITGQGTALTLMPVSGVLTFTNTDWNMAQTVTVTATEDDDADDDTVTLTHEATGAAEYGLVTDDVEVTVTDDDTAGVTISDTDITVDEAGDTASYTVVLDTQPADDVVFEVRVAMSGVTADPMKLTFTSGDWNEAQMVMVTGVDDDMDNDGRVVSIRHFITDGAPGYATGAAGVVTVTVNDDDVVAGLSFSSPSVDVDEGATTSYTVALAAAPTVAVTVEIDGYGGTDLTPDVTSLMFTTDNWDMPQTVLLRANHDPDIDVDMLMLTHTAMGGGYDLITDVVVVTITDDDTVGLVFDPASASVTVDEGDMETYTVALGAAPTAAVTVTITSQADTALTLTPASALTFTAANWDMGQAVTVTANPDGDTDNDTVTLTHTASGATEYVSVMGDVTVTVTDDDTAGVTISETTATVVENGGMATYTVVLDSQPAGNVEITATSDETTAATVSAQPLTFTMDNWDQEQMVTITGVNDAIANAAARTATISHRISSGDSDEYPTDGLTPDPITVTVTDDDMAGLVFDPASVAVRADDGDSYTVTLGSEPTANVTVTITGQSGTDLTLTSARDGRAFTGVLTFTSADWNEEQTVFVNADEDADMVNNRVPLTHTATGTAAEYDSVTGRVTITIIDNDAPGVTIIESSGDTEVAENGGTATYAVVLNTQPAGDVQITATSDPTSAATLSAQPLTFTTADWSQAQTVTITGVSDDIVAARTATISHRISSTSDSTNYPIGGLTPASITVTVTDDDTAGLVFDPASVTVNEGATATYTVALTSEPTAAVTVTITGQGIALTLTPASTLTFTAANWAEAQTVTVTANRDADANDDTVTLTHAASGATEYVSVADDVMVTIIDNDTPGVTISETTATVAENAGTATYTVVLDTQPAGNVEITATSVPTTAATVSAQPLTFTMINWNEAQMVTITGVSDDNVAARTATISHRISSGDSGNYPADGLTPASITVTVTDDDTAGLVFDPASVTVNEGDMETYTVALTSEPTAAVTVTITGQGIALTLTPASTLTFTAANWNDGQTVTAMAEQNGDTGNDTVTLTHTASGATEYGAVTDDVTVTIIDDDGPGVIISETTAEVAENDGTATYTVVLNTQPAGDVQITATSDPTLAVTVSAQPLTFTMVNWDRAQTVTITGVNDDNAAARTATISHRISSGDSGDYPADDSLTLASITVTVINDDTAGVTISEATAAVAENGGTATYTVVLDTQPAGDVQITASSDAPAAATVSAQPLTFTMANWNEAQTVTITGVNDDIAAAGTATISHRISSGDSGGYPADDSLTPASIIVTVTDDDTVGLVFDPASVTVDQGATKTYTVALTSEPTAAVTVTITGQGIALTLTPASALTFTDTNWNDGQTVTVMAEQNGDTGNDTVTLTHTASGATEYGSVTGEVMVTVTDGGAAEMQAAQEMWLPRFGLMAVEHMLNGLDYRFSVTDRPPGLSGNLNGLSGGQSLSAATGTGPDYTLGAGGFGRGGGGDGFGAGSVDRLMKVSRSLLLRDVLRGSRFVYYDQNRVSDNQNRVAVWGQVSHSRFEDAQDGVSVDGEVTTGILGVDNDNGRTLLGLALSYSDGEGDWSGTAGSGELSSQLTSLLPYIRHKVTQRLQVWGAASYGLGKLEQTSSASGSTSKNDIEQISASIGARGTLLERPAKEGGLTLTLISDATLARIESDDDAVSGITADTQQLRLGLEWSWQLPQADGGRIVPELELGLRYDSGDTSEGLGLELGGGISWEWPASGLALDVRGRSLLDHEAEQRREWGISGSLRYDLQPGSSHGPSLSITQEYGNAAPTGGLDQLLSGSLSDTLEEDASTPGEASGRWSLKGEWGFALEDGGTGIPYAALSSAAANRDLTLGWRLLSDPDSLDMELDIKALRREEDEGEASHSIGAELKLRW